MAVIKCGSVDCKHNDDSNICQKSNIALSDCYCHTVNGATAFLAMQTV